MYQKSMNQKKQKKFKKSRQGYAILIREELAAQNKNKQNRDTISRQFS